MKYKVTEKDIFGEIEDFPIEIVQKMVERCIEENEVNIITKLQISRLDGFLWGKSIEGYDFWASVVYDKDFDLFFEKYPKNKNIIIKNFKKKFNQFLNWISKLKNKRHGNNK